MGNSVLPCSPDSEDPLQIMSEAQLMETESTQGGI